MNETCRFCGEQTEFMHRYENGWFCEAHTVMGKNFLRYNVKPLHDTPYKKGIPIRDQQL